MTNLMGLELFIIPTNVFIKGISKTERKKGVWKRFQMVMNTPESTKKINFMEREFLKIKGYVTNMRGNSKMERKKARGQKNIRMELFTLVNSREI